MVRLPALSVLLLTIVVEPSLRVVIAVPAMSIDVRAVLAVKSSTWTTMLSPGDPLSGTAVTLPSTSNLEEVTSEV